jgi:hypothetical protein
MVAGAVALGEISVDHGVSAMTYFCHECGGWYLDWTDVIHEETQSCPDLHEAWTLLPIASQRLRCVVTRRRVTMEPPMVQNVNVNVILKLGSTSSTCVRL